MRLMSWRATSISPYDAARIITIPTADGGKCAKLSGVVNGAARIYGSESTT